MDQVVSTLRPSLRRRFDKRLWNCRKESGRYVGRRESIVVCGFVRRRIHFLGGFGLERQEVRHTRGIDDMAQDLEIVCLIYAPDHSSAPSKWS
jgi:hypothetical protein